MGVTVSTILTKSDDYIDPNKTHYPPMTVSVYETETLQETFEAPSGFDLKKFANNKTKFGFYMITSVLINEKDRQGITVYVNDKRYVGIYNIDHDPNHYISDTLRDRPPMTVTVHEFILNERFNESFEAPSGFDLDKYAARFPDDRLVKSTFNYEKGDQKKVITLGEGGFRQYVGVYKKVEEEPISVCVSKEPDQN